MKLEELNEYFLLYGELSVLNNRMQACENEGYSDLTMKQHFLLVSIYLFKEEYPTLKESGDLIGCSYQNVKRLALQLEKKGYLSIVTDAVDKRKLRLIPTGKFEELGVEKNNLAEKFMQRLYQNVPPDELHIALKTIRQMADNIKEG